VSDGQADIQERCITGLTSGSAGGYGMPTGSRRSALIAMRTLTVPSIWRFKSNFNVIWCSRVHRRCHLGKARDLTELQFEWRRHEDAMVCESAPGS